MAIRIWAFSDLHCDLGPVHKLPDPQPDHDLVIIAGDTCERLHRGVRWAANAGFTKPVIMVAGNHCFYNAVIDAEIDKARAEAAKASGIHVLENDRIDLEIGGKAVRALGATLWTDYAIDGEARRPIVMSNAYDFMNDHRRIRVAKDGSRKFRPDDALARHRETVAWLGMQLDEPFDGIRIVVTHHAPSFKSCHPDRMRDGLNGAYMSHLDEMVSRADLWVHGHVHQAHDYRIGDARVICNPRGYVGYEATGWNPELVIGVLRQPRSHVTSEKVE